MHVYMSVLIDMPVTLLVCEQMHCALCWMFFCAQGVQWGTWRVVTFPHTCCSGRPWEELWPMQWATCFTHSPHRLLPDQYQPLCVCVSYFFDVSVDNYSSTNYTLVRQSTSLLITLPYFCYNFFFPASIHFYISYTALFYRCTWQHVPKLLVLADQ